MIVNRLTQREVGAMIEGVVGNKLLPTSLRQDIVERSDGIPLCVEEMTKAVLEAESEGEARRTVAAVPLAVPPTLHASLFDGSGSRQHKRQQVGVPQLSGEPQPLCAPRRGLVGTTKQY
jgi:hypothetical protein